MNQVNHSGAFSKSPSVSATSSPTYNGYAHFAKFNIPELSKSSTFIKPPHMQDPSYVSAHDAKPSIDHKVVALNDLEEPIKMTILSDIERDQRLQAFKHSLDKNYDNAVAKQEELQRKRKADQESFERFVKRSDEKLSDLQNRYNELYGRYTKLQQKYGELIEQNQDTDIKINGAIFENSRLKTLLAMRDREITDLN